MLQRPAHRRNIAPRIEQTEQQVHAVHRPLHLLGERLRQHTLRRQRSALEQIVVERQVGEVPPRLGQRQRFDLRILERQRVVAPPQGLKRGNRLVAEKAVGILERRDERRHRPCARDLRQGPGT